MNISFIGYGSMAKSVESIAKNRGHKTVSKIDVNDEISAKNIGKSDVIFDATVPDAFLTNYKKIFSLKKDIVVATTGWYDNMEEIKQQVEKAKIRFLYSSNFSIGVNIYFHIINYASKLINKTEEYDIWGTEIHHKNKADSPSGTAKILEKILLKNIARKQKIVEHKLDRKIKNDEIHFSSTRGGETNFGHTIAFDSDADYIKIEHAARNRGGYALGAVKVMEWLKNQPIGFYSMEDYIKNILA